MNQQNKEFEKLQDKENSSRQSENNTEEENANEDNNDYNEQFDLSKYNVVSMDNINKNKKEENEDKNNNNENKEAICLICQRKFASLDKLKLHEKLSELHRQNLEKLKLNNN